MNKLVAAGLAAGVGAGGYLLYRQGLLPGGKPDLATLKAQESQLQEEIAALRARIADVKQKVKSQADIEGAERACTRILGFIQWCGFDSAAVANAQAEVFKSRWAELGAPLERHLSKLEAALAQVQGRIR
ncbi:MAG: hypothetical protein H5T84_11435 [Thermoleophilia bacterium]|nr:hypothetical protein [Thermoleophilia bacterium]